MAKYERRLRGNFDEVLRLADNAIMKSMSASVEAGSDAQFGDVRVAVRVYERYSWIGGNRVSLNLTVVGSSDDLFVSAISSGGSQAVFFKINTWGEESFLDTLARALDSYAEGRW
ncbi:MAG: DUF6054 family protein [Eubacteriales bacterium]|nr:DUF6054 family protein [Eubacteriales bacterium]MDD4541882.1 DUF6054 family protein [Eubacteriales bacterium]